MTIRRLALAAFFLSSIASIGIARPMLNFTVDLRDTKSHQVHVTLVPSGFSARKAVYQMPIWAPGAYSVTGYGRYVVNFKASDKKGHYIAVKQLDENRWEILNGKSVQKIEYDVLDSHKDTTSLYFAMANMDTSLFFANATCLFGYFDDDKSASAQVEYQKPSDWKLVCSLPPSEKGYIQDTNASFQNTTFYAKDYDALADAPIMAAPGLVTKSFNSGSAIYDVAVASDGNWSNAKMDSLIYYLREIVRAETDFFHDTPYDHYTFEIVAPTYSHMPSTAQGALEHWNSSDYLLANFGWSFFKGAFLSTFSHEFFHLWNVKRIHSNLLGPFDYTKRVMTTSLWMAEGITEYYAHTLLSRYGILTPGAFFYGVEQWRKEMDDSPDAAKAKSLEQLSIDESTFDLDEAELFYSKGPLVALALDIEIRYNTNNKKSLDDVMLALNDDAKHGKTFREDQLIKLVEKYSGVDLTDFYNRYIKGNEPLPMDKYYAMMGLSLTTENNMAPDTRNRTVISPDTGIEWSVNLLDMNGALATAGVRIGDHITSINGERVSMENVVGIMSNEDTARITLERDGEKKQIVVLPKPKPKKLPHSLLGPMEIDPNATPLANEIRKGITGQ